MCSCLLLAVLIFWVSFYLSSLLRTVRMYKASNFSLKLTSLLRTVRMYNASHFLVCSVGSYMYLFDNYTSSKSLLPLLPAAEVASPSPSPFLTPWRENLQRGQEALILSHWSKHSTWKWCEQGSALSWALSLYLPRQMQQACSEKLILSLRHWNMHHVWLYFTFHAATHKCTSLFSNVLCTVSYTWLR